MNMILTTIAQEKKRIEYMLAKYQEEYDRLPKGSLSERKTGGKSYYYLKYRDGKKVVSKFLGNVVDYNIEELKENLNKRKDLSKVIKKLKLEQKEILKELR